MNILVHLTKKARITVDVITTEANMLDLDDSSPATLKWTPWLCWLETPGAQSILFLTQTRQMLVINDHGMNSTRHATLRHFGKVQPTKLTRQGC